MHCGNRSQREENFLSLSVMIPAEYQGRSKVVSSLKKVRSSVAKIKREAKRKDKKKKKQDAAEIAQDRKAKAKRAKKRTGVPAVPDFSAASSSSSKTPSAKNCSEPAKSFGSASVRAARPRVLSSVDISDSETESNNSSKCKPSQRRRLHSTSCTLQDCLRAHTAKEYLTGDSQYFCEKCGCKRDATKRVVSSNNILLSLSWMRN